MKPVYNERPSQWRSCLCGPINVWRRVWAKSLYKLRITWTRSPISCELQSKGFFCWLFEKPQSDGYLETASEVRDPRNDVFDFKCILNRKYFLAVWVYDRFYVWVRSSLSSDDSTAMWFLSHFSEDTLRYSVYLDKRKVKKSWYRVLCWALYVWLQFSLWCWLMLPPKTAQKPFSLKKHKVALIVNHPCRSYITS